MGSILLPGEWLQRLSPPPMPDVVTAVELMCEVRQAAERGERCWNKLQMNDVIRSMRHFIDAAEASMKKP